MYLAYPTRTAAAFGFIAFVLLTGGNANAQTACFGVGPEALTRALNAIDEVDVEVEDIEVSDPESMSPSSFVTLYYSIDDEHSCLADERTSYCAIAEVEGVERKEGCSDSAPMASGSRFKAVVVFDRIHGEYNVKAKVRVRYYGAGGTYTSWSPEYRELSLDPTSTVPFKSIR